jgi:hypothetical protein
VRAAGSVAAGSIDLRRPRWGRAIGGGGTRRAGSWAAGGSAVRAGTSGGRFRRRARRWWGRQGNGRRWQGRRRARWWPAQRRGCSKNGVGRAWGAEGSVARAETRAASAVVARAEALVGGGEAVRAEGGSAPMWRKRGAASGSSGGEDGRLGYGGDREAGGGEGAGRWRPWRQWRGCGGGIASVAARAAAARAAVQGRWQTWRGGAEDGRPHLRTAP